MKRKLIALSLSISILSGTFFTLPIDKNVYANDLKNEGTKMKLFFWMKKFI